MGLRFELAQGLLAHVHDDGALCTAVSCTVNRGEP